jgi:hypothetical protein
MAKVRKVRTAKFRKSSPTPPEPVADETPAATPDVVPSFPENEPLVSEFEASPQLDQLAAAFTEFRRLCPNPQKDKAGYNYRYATLANIVVNTQELLADHGLSVVQFPTSSKLGLGCITMLMHSSGQYIRGRFVMPVPSMKGSNLTQEAGAAITYARRYALSAVLCIAADEDTDANYE